MSAILMDGKALAKQVQETLAQQCAAFVQTHGYAPGLAVVLVGDDPASQVYVRNKERACKKVGFYSRVYRLPTATCQADLLQLMDTLNADAAIHGILVQSPLPKHLDEAAVVARICPEKDVDGFHVQNAGRLFVGQRGFVACTPKGVLRLLDAYDIPIRGKHAVVVGRSNIVGKPVAMLLLGRDATVTCCHSRTEDLPAITRTADILVSAVGHPQVIRADMVKPGAVVIDVGINRTEAGLVGDVDPAVASVAAYMTPVPGGVGPMTIAMLLENTMEAAQQHA